MATTHRTTRRAFLGSTALAGATAAFGGTGASAQSHPKYGESDYQFEIMRTDEEWRGILTEYEHSILRLGGTEWPKSNPLWEDYREGAFSCRGCDLDLYSSDHRVELNKGWVFFAHSQPNAVLTGIDTGSPYSPNASMSETKRRKALIEAHCRRCGSHLGHILIISGKLVHCINGTSLKFDPSTA